MPEISVNGARLHYEDEGSGPETIVFAHGLLYSGLMFGAQVAAFKQRYRCIRFDFRGQGRSEVTESGYDMDTFYEDAVGLIEKLGCAPCHFVGLSMGGFVGMRLAIRKPGLLRSLTLMETSADPEPAENKGKYRLLGLVARWLGLGLVGNRVMPIMIGQKMLQDPSRREEVRLWRERLLSNHRVGIHRALGGVVDRQGVYEQLDRIDLPTLIIVGDQDVATVPAKSEHMHRRIRGSRLVIIPGAGHSSSIEEPAAVNAAMADFLSHIGS